MDTNALAEFEDIGEPDEVMYLMSKDKVLHIAYSENMEGNYEKMLDMLESAAIMLLLSLEKGNGSKENVH